VSALIAEGLQPGATERDAIRAHVGTRRLLDNTGESAANFRRVTGMSGEMDGEALRQELDQNVVKSNGPGITIVSADEDEPGNQWSERPR
jgi:hypothetical protein